MFETYAGAGGGTHPDGVGPEGATVGAMSNAAKDTGARMVGAIPYVWVADVEKAIPYYRDVLGFDIEFTHGWEWKGEKYGLALVARDEVTLHLRVCECGDYRHTGTAFYQVEVEGVDALHKEYAKGDAIIRFEPATQDWGVRDFQIDDPEGNRIYFYENL